MNLNKSKKKANAIPKIKSREQPSRKARIGKFWNEVKMSENNIIGRSLARESHRQSAIN